MERIQKFDLHKINEKLDANGYLRVSGYAARTGVLKYDDTSEMVSPEELFNNDSLQSIIGVPITIDHPSEGVNGSNARNESVGSVVAAGQEEGSLRVDMVIHSDDAIDRIRGGVTELSCGYNCKVTKADGVVNGESYDSVQSDRIYNHLAIVKFGRAGSACSLKFDAEKNMTEIKEVQDKLDAANEVAKSEAIKLDAANKEIGELKAKVDTLEADAEAKAKVDHSDVASLLAVVERAKVIKSDSVAIVEGKLLSEAEVMAAAVGEKADSLEGEALIGYFNAMVDFKADSEKEVNKLNKADAAPKSDYVSGRDKFLSGVK